VADSDVSAELERLASLYERGLLTDNEFATAKERALRVTPSGAEPADQPARPVTVPTTPVLAIPPTPRLAHVPRPFVSWKLSFAVVGGALLVIVVLGLMRVNLGGLGWPVAILGLYFLPTMIAHYRKVTNLGSVAVINVFLGWTFIGWVVALAMAARSASSRVTG
jgi:hypothetical protein